VVKVNYVSNRKVSKKNGQVGRGPRRGRPTQASGYAARENAVVSKKDHHGEAGGEEGG